MPKYKIMKKKQKPNGNNNENMPCKRLGHYIIIDYGKYGKRWHTICDTGETTLDVLTGKVFVDKQLDITWLSSWKVRGEAPEQFKNIQDFETELAQLPVWDETKWASKAHDFGGVVLIDCRTGELDSESAEAKAQIKRIRDSKIAMN
jgi:hypothetical protein